MAAAEADACAPCMMDSRDGTGDGDGGNEICVMGMPVEGGGGGGVGGAPVDGTAAVVASGAESISEMTGTEAGKAGMPPYPGRP